MADKDVTSLVRVGGIDDFEVACILKCVCGAEFPDWSFGESFLISIYEDDPHKCPKCGARLYFRAHIQVFQKE